MCSSLAQISMNKKDCLCPIHNRTASNHLDRYSHVPPFAAQHSQSKTGRDHQCIMRFVVVNCWHNQLFLLSQPLCNFSTVCHPAICLNFMFHFCRLNWSRPTNNHIHMVAWLCPTTEGKPSLQTAAHFMPWHCYVVRLAHSSSARRLSYTVCILF